MKRYIWTQWLLIAMLSFMITACGGGGGSVGNPTDTNDTNTTNPPTDNNDTNTTNPPTDNNDTNTTNPPPDDTQPPRADTFTPKDGSKNVPIYAKVSARFDEAMLESSINNKTFVLYKNMPISQNILNARVHYDSTNNKVELFPNSNLSLLTKYTAQLKSSIKDLAGNKLAPTQWSFTTTDGQWKSKSEFISWKEDLNAKEVSQEPRVAIDTLGNAIAVWHTIDKTGNLGVATSYRTISQDQWDNKKQFLSHGVTVFSSVEVSMNASGEAVVVWAQKESNGVVNIWSNRFSRAKGWGTAEKIETDESSLKDQQPQVAIDQSGNAIAVWLQKDNTVYRIYANRFDAKQGKWGTAHAISYNFTTNNNVYFAAPKIAMNDKGNAIVTWVQNGDEVYVNKYFSGWGKKAERLAPPDTPVGNLQIAIDNNSNALIVWRTTPKDGLYSAYYYPKSQIWSKVARITNLKEFRARIAMSKTGLGRPVVLYNISNNISTSLYARTYHKDSNSWGARLRLSKNASSPYISMDDNGNALILAKPKIGLKYGLSFIRYTYHKRFLLTSFSKEKYLLAANNNVYDPHIAINSVGYGVGVWYNLLNNGDWRIESNFFK